MADKKISDFATLTDVQSNDLLLVSSENETYNINAQAFMDSIGDDVFDAIGDAAILSTLSDDDTLVVPKSGELRRVTVDTLLQKVGGVVHYDKAQTLSTSQKQTARDNISAPSASDLQALDSNVVHVDKAQSLTSTKKQTARDNIDAPSKGDVTDLSNNVVHADKTQSFSNGYKQQARDNIDAASKAELATESTNLSSNITTLSGNVVHVDSQQTLTTSQKATGRANIDAVSTSELATVNTNLSGNISTLSGNVVHIDQAQTLTAAQKSTGRSNIDAVSTSDLSALDDRVKDLEYVPIEVSNFRITTPENGIARMGSTVSSIIFAWAVNSIPVSQKLSGTGITGTLDIDTDDRSTEVSVSLTSNGTYTMTAKGDSSPSHPSGSTNSKTCTLYFYNDVYWGVAASATVDSAFVRGLSNSVLSGSRARTVTVNATSGKYIWYAVPTRLGTCSFNVGGFDGGFESPQTVSVTNASGYTENYYVYRSTNASLGNTTVKVS